ncbi:MAG TPA: radical SAM protein, partial [Acidobacteriaceae bacterium]
GGKKVGLDTADKYDLVLNEDHVHAAANDTFEKSGIAKNAREEKIRARDAKLKQDAENARMAKLYRKEILQEPDAPAGFISLGEIQPAATPAPKVEETVAGD